MSKDLTRQAFVRAGAMLYYLHYGQGPAVEGRWHLRKANGIDGVEFIWSAKFAGRAFQFDYTYTCGHLATGSVNPEGEALFLRRLARQKLDQAIRAERAKNDVDPTEPMPDAGANQQAQA